MITTETLNDAKNRLLQGREKGMRCPCCNRFVKVYHRKLHSGQARQLIVLDKYFKTKINALSAKNAHINPSDWYVHAEKLFLSQSVPSTDFGKLEHWGLIESGSSVGLIKGFWKLTTTGKEFANNRITVPMRIAFYNNEPIGFSEEKTTIKQALGDHFDYEELMSAHED